MAKRVTNEDIKLMNDIYYRTKSYAETARQTGWSAGTVSKYVDKNYTPIAAVDPKRFELADLPDFDPAIFRTCPNWGALCVHTDTEKEALIELWEELAI